MQVLEFAKPPALRKETVDVPELGGAVVVRGLLLRESFAVALLRQQALRRVVAEQREARERFEAAVAAANPDAPPPPMPTADPATLNFDELLAYGSYVSHLLHCAVLTSTGTPLFSADQWEAVGQHHPQAVQRLQAVAERLSGLDAEDVEKNSASSPTAPSASG